MHVDTGWAGRYRDGPAWTPIRVTLRNSKSSSVGGSVEVRDDAVGATIGSQSLIASYQQSVILPPGASKQLSLYVPGADVGTQLDVSFISGHQVLARGSSFPAKFLPGDMTVGIFTRDPANTSWINGLRLKGGHRVTPIPLTATTLDPVPEVLAAFDAIVVSNADTSTLDRDQLTALERYVHNGGSLLVVGGPDWAATVHPLLGSLIPGLVSSSRTIHRLTSLQAFRYGPSPTGAATVSVLTQTKGPVLLAQNGLPLVVRSLFGNGVIEYWAFDPSLAPLLHWRTSQLLLSQLMGDAMPLAMRRVSLPTGYDSASFLGPPSGPLSLNAVLASLPASSLRDIILIALVLLYVLLCGPLLVLSLKRVERSGLTWAALPAMALLFTSATAGVASTVKSTGSVVKAVGMLEMDGTGDRYPLDLYAEVSSPSGTSHHLTYDAPAVVQPVLGDDSFSLATERSLWSIAEGTSTTIGFSSTGENGLNTFSLRTSAPVGGAMRANLHLSASGLILGTVQNETGITLVRPAIIAGRSFERLPDMPPGGVVRVHLLPQNNPHHHVYAQSLFRLYGSVSGHDNRLVPTSQRDYTRRIQNALGALPETNIVSMLGEVSLVGWTSEPLGRLLLDGRSGNGSQLTMIVKPLKLTAGIGAFRLRQGSVGAYLVDQTPALAKYPCCSPSPYAVYIGNGGDATFEFDLPAHQGIHYRNLRFSIYGGGPDASYTGYSSMASGSAEVYDWATGKWITLNFRRDNARLPRADRFVSSSGALLVKLLVRSDSHELTITDPRQDLQISGTAGVG